MSQRRRDQLTRDLFRDWLVDIVKWGLLYTPPFALIVTLFFDRYDDAVDFWRSFLKSMYIGEVVLIFSVTMSYILAVAESGLFKKLKRDLDLIDLARITMYGTIQSTYVKVKGLKFLNFD